jgi:hypothetical protein
MVTRRPGARGSGYAAPDPPAPATLTSRPSHVQPSHAHPPDAAALATRAPAASLHPNGAAFG